MPFLALPDEKPVREEDSKPEDTKDDLILNDMAFLESMAPSKAKHTSPERKRRSRSRDRDRSRRDRSRDRKRDRSRERSRRDRSRSGDRGGRRNRSRERTRYVEPPPPSDPVAGMIYDGRVANI